MNTPASLRSELIAIRSESLIDIAGIARLGAHVLEVVSRHDGDTYRAVYTVRLKAAVYVLHAFQKKARRGTATPKQEIDLVKHRLKAAEQHYTETYGAG